MRLALLFLVVTRTRPFVYLVTHSDGAWHVWLAGSATTARVHATREEAIRDGQRCAEASTPSQLRIHDEDGTLEVARNFYGRVRAGSGVYAHPPRPR